MTKQKLLSKIKLYKKCTFNLTCIHCMHVCVCNSSISLFESKHYTILGYMSQKDEEEEK